VQVPDNRAGKRLRTEDRTSKAPDETLSDREMEEEEQGVGPEQGKPIGNVESDSRDSVEKQVQVVSSEAGGSESSAAEALSVGGLTPGRERESESHRVSSHSSAQPSSAGSAKLAPAQRQPPPASQASPLAAGPAGPGGGAFGAQHLAHVLRAAFPSKRAMTRLVQDVKAKSDAFRPVQLSSQANGGAYTREQIAARIVECRPLHVDSAGQLLSWLTVCVTPKPF